MYTLLLQNNEPRIYLSSVTELPGGNSEWEPPDPIPNSEVKRLAPMIVWGLPM